MSPSGTTYLGIDIGGTKTCVATVTADGRVVESWQSPTPATQGPDAILARAADLVRAACGSRPVERVGVGTAGVVDHVSGRILSATDALPGWAGTDVVGGLSALLDDADVAVVNDVHAFALGEGRAGAARSARNYLAVTVGTGVGGAVVVDGRLVHGAHDVAGHLGHMTVPGADGVPCPCGRLGHLEAVASGPGILQTYRALGGVADDARGVARALVTGDRRAADAVRRAGRALGTALGSLVNVLDPEVVVLGGGAAAIPGLREAAEESLRETAMPSLATVPLRRAELDASAAVGAALLGVPA
ncbi:ROK family protein [Paraoerskovia marina]|uniref:ROK family protein n=1 Tax=Paraoerskovia marina TaxID=545619 RepID=UPI000492A9A2|nr:ROK family protein [Paraoerskovia marina]